MKIRAMAARGFGLLAILLCTGLHAENSAIPEQATAQNEVHFTPLIGLKAETSTIRSGDNLDVRVVEDPSFNGKYSVRRGGYIIVPQIGRIAVADKTKEEAAAAVEKALEAAQVPKATVTIEIIKKPAEKKRE
jgi:protein involved in polysaccharide export with SLBB domain